MLFRKKKEALITLGIGQGIPVIPAPAEPARGGEHPPDAPAPVKTHVAPVEAALPEQGQGAIAALEKAIPVVVPVMDKVPAVAEERQPVLTAPAPGEAGWPAPPDVEEAPARAGQLTPEHAEAAAAPLDLPAAPLPGDLLPVELPPEIREDAGKLLDFAEEAAVPAETGDNPEFEMFQTVTPDAPDLPAAAGLDAGPAAPSGWAEESDVPLEQCPYCLASVPTSLDFCDKCGNRIHDAVLAPGEDSPVSEDLFETPLNGAAPLDLDTTRKLTVKPVPDLLQGTTLLQPARLILHAGSYKDEQTQPHTLALSTTSVGRGSDNDFPFPEEEFISRHHCEIVYHKYQYVLKDLNSANGTYVNDVRVKETILRDGDSIQMGALRFTFEDPMEKIKKKKAQSELD